MAKRDYYEVLGIDRDATEKDIKRAYRHLARRHHPDVNGTDPDAERKFKEIAEAYEVLSDNEKRHQYDAFGHTKSGMGFDGFGAFDDLFGMVFGDFGARSQTRATTERGSDLICDISIELEDAYRGVEKNINLKKALKCEECNGTGAEPGTSPIECLLCNGSGVIRTTQRTFFGNLVKTHTCNRCGGRGKIISSVCKVCDGEGRIKKDCSISIKIPAGATSGLRFKINGQGEAGFRGGPFGDLFVDVYVQPHSIFEVRGNDLMCDFAISFSQAALGATIDIFTFDGDEKLKIPPGIQGGTIFNLRGKGLPCLNSRRRGDQLIRILVATPTKLSAAQKELFKRLDEIGEENLGIKKRLSD